MLNLSAIKSLKQFHAPIDMQIHSAPIEDPLFLFRFAFNSKKNLYSQFSVEIKQDKSHSQEPKQVKVKEKQESVFFKKPL